ncbi:hypothetical protein M8J77_022034 [Diaphorina citri]|nr:hypothetical protein M8J77_022034 [Diaphorina citri]
MSFNALDKLAYANKENENYVSFVDYFNTELTKKKTQELRSIKEDFSVYIKLEDDKTKILEGAQETLKGKLKTLKYKIQDVKKEHESEIEEVIKKLNFLAEELENVAKAVKEAKREKLEMETNKDDTTEKLEKVQKELDNETKKLQLTIRKNENKREELKNCKVKQDELLAELEEKSRELKENFIGLKEENKETKAIKKKYYDTKMLSRSLVEQFNKLKYQNSLDLLEKELVQASIKEREILTAELSQLIIAKLDPNIDEKTVAKLDEIMKELDTIIEYGKNISQHIQYLRQLKLN